MRQIEGYMMIGHHTLVTMERTTVSYRVATYGVTPQDDGSNVKALLASSFTEFRRCQYASNEIEAVSAFASVVASELNDERQALESMRCQQHLTVAVG
jgi:hypothetical protein